MTDYTDFRPIIDAYGVSVTVKLRTLSTINTYGEEVFTETTSTKTMLIQSYISDTHGIVSSMLEEVPEFVAYSLESINKNSLISYNTKTYKIIDINIQPIKDTYIYYKLFLKQIA